MLICIYACFWPLMRLGGAYLIKASSEAGPWEADSRGEEEMSQQGGCGPGRRRLPELSLVYKIEEGLAGLCGWQTGLKMEADLEVRSRTPALALAVFNPLDKSWLFSRSVDPIKWRVGVMPLDPLTFPSYCEMKK